VRAAFAAMADAAPRSPSLRAAILREVGVTSPSRRAGSSPSATTRPQIDRDPGIAEPGRRRRAAAARRRPPGPRQPAGLGRVHPDRGEALRRARPSHYRRARDRQRVHPPRWPPRLVTVALPAAPATPATAAATAVAAGLRWVLDPDDDLACVRALSARHDLAAGIVVCSTSPAATSPVLTRDLLVALGKAPTRSPRKVGSARVTGCCRCGCAPSRCATWWCCAPTPCARPCSQPCTPSPPPPRSPHGRSGITPARHRRWPASTLARRWAGPQPSRRPPSARADPTGPAGLSNTSAPPLAARPVPGPRRGRLHHGTERCPDALSARYCSV